MREVPEVSELDVPEGRLRELRLEVERRRSDTRSVQHHESFALPKRIATCAQLFDVIATRLAVYQEAPEVTRKPSVRGEGAIVGANKQYREGEK